MNSLDHSGALSKKLVVGRNILVAALLVFVVSTLAEKWTDDVNSARTWPVFLLRNGPWFLLFYFATRGGSLSVRLVRILLATVAGVIAICFCFLLAGSLSPQPTGPTFAEISKQPWWNTWGLLLDFLGFGFLIWAFFFSASVRSYVKHRQAQGS